MFPATTYDLGVGGAGSKRSGSGIRNMSIVVIVGYRAEKIVIVRYPWYNWENGGAGRIAGADRKL